MAEPLFQLLRELVDYAGLFPPAKLPLDRVVRNFAEYSRSDERWMLGRLIVRLDDLLPLSQIGPKYQLPQETAWRLSCLLPNVEANPLRSAAQVMQQFNQRHTLSNSFRAVIDTVEVKVTSLTEAESVAAAIPAGVRVFCELPFESAASLAPALPQIKNRTVGAKFRTGGVTADLIPDQEELLKALTACVSAGASFKATAGLHHAIRGEYPLTYEQNSECANMHGFLNLLTATLILCEDATRLQLALEALNETDRAVFSVADDHWRWNGVRFSAQAVQHMRHQALISYGSCSFIEPVEELQSLGLLLPR